MSEMNKVIQSSESLCNIRILHEIAGIMLEMQNKCETRVTHHLHLTGHMRLIGPGF